MKTISVRCQNAYLVCLGIKDVENRTWKTDYRGELLIHSSGKSFDELDLNFFPKKWLKEFETERLKGRGQSDLRYLKILDEFYKKLYAYYGTTDSESKQYKSKPGFLRAQAIIGKVNLVDVVRNSKSEWAEPFTFNYHWILKDAELFSLPILFVKGKLKLFDYDLKK